MDYLKLHIHIAQTSIQILLIQTFEENIRIKYGILNTSSHKKFLCLNLNQIYLYVIRPFKPNKDVLLNTVFHGLGQQRLKNNFFLHFPFYRTLYKKYLFFFFINLYIDCMYLTNFLE